MLRQKLENGRSASAAVISLVGLQGHIGPSYTRRSGDSENAGVNKSPLPLTDPRDAVPCAHRVVDRCRRSVWWTGDRWRSPIYHTDRPPKAAASLGDKPPELPADEIWETPVDLSAVEKEISNGNLIMFSTPVNHLQDVGFWRNSWNGGLFAVCCNCCCEYSIGRRGGSTEGARARSLPLYGCCPKNWDARPIKSRFNQFQNAPKIAFWAKNKNSPLSRPFLGGEGDTPFLHPTPSAPLALDLCAYRASGPGLIPVYSQSARRWL